MSEDQNAPHQTTRSTLIETTPLFAAIREKEEAIKELQGEIEQLYALIADIEEGKHVQP